MKRYVYYLLGMNILVLGITCNTLSNLGVGAFSTLPFALSSLSALTFGIIIERKISVKFVLEIPFSFIFGFLVDFYQYLIPSMDLNIYTQIIVLLFGNTCCAIGVYFMLKGDLIMTPVDGLVLSISEVSHKPYSICKNCFDISMILSTVVVCLVCRSPIYGIGVGTVFSAFYIGRVIRFCENLKLNTYKKIES